MGLRCSLLGHDYGDSEVEREREEQGSEVVVTIREQQTCSRCGKTKLLSENKEVTSLAISENDRSAAEHSSASPDSASPRQDAEAQADDGSRPSGSDSQAGRDDGGSLLDDGSDQDSATAASPDGRDAEIIDEGPGDEVPAATREAASVADEETADETPVDPEADPEDDAVILDETEDDHTGPRERERGEWPDADDTRRGDAGGGEPQEWPDVDDGRDEGYDARPDSGEPADVEFGGGLTPESGVSADDDERMIESAESAETGTTGFASAGDAPSPVEADGEDEATEFVCPACGHTAGGVGSSLRAGDICPECKKGYIAER